MGLLVLPFFLTTFGLILLLATSPFATPWVDRTASELDRALTSAMARAVTPDWARREMELALATGDFDRVQTVALVAAEHGLAPDPDLAARIDTLEAEITGFWASARTCGSCIADIAQCPSVAMIATCGLPVELTPVGDLNALRRAGWAAATGGDVDKIDVTLAIVGLGATATVVITAGSSASVKAGATSLRVARKMGTLTPRFSGELSRLARVDLKPKKILPYMHGTATLDELLDTAKLARLQDVTGDLTRVARNTSITDTLVLMRYVDGADDAARLARLSDIRGARTSSTLAVLGKSRVFRTMVKLTDVALATAALIYAAVLQVVLFGANAAGSACLRGVRRLI